jgi:selenocysteine-specific translation elongation factor
MASLNIAVLGEDAQTRAAFAQSLGKKSTPQDITFYHSVFGGKIINAIEATAYPARLSALVQSAVLADVAVVNAGALSPALGETIIALDLLGVPAVFVTPLDLAPMLCGTGLAQSKCFGEFSPAREHVLSLGANQDESLSANGNTAFNANPDGNRTTILIDHCFEVKGVGTVALGVVKKGAVNVHDKLKALPLARQIEVKSIQKNDDDVASAQAGDRVGLALKGAKAVEVPRGTVLVDAENAQPASQINCSIAVSKFCKAPLKDGAALHLACGLQFEPCRVKCSGEIKPGAAGAATQPTSPRRLERIVLCTVTRQTLSYAQRSATRTRCFLPPNAGSRRQAPVGRLATTQCILCLNLPAMEQSSLPPATRLNRFQSRSSAKTFSPCCPA